MGKKQTFEFQMCLFFFYYNIITVNPVLQCTEMYNFIQFRTFLFNFVSCDSSFFCDNSLFQCFYQSFTVYITQNLEPTASEEPFAIIPKPSCLFNLVMLTYCQRKTNVIQSVQIPHRPFIVLAGILDNRISYQLCIIHVSSSRPK